jgi:hypothetical protein
MRRSAREGDYPLRHVPQKTDKLRPRGNQEPVPFSRAGVREQHAIFSPQKLSFFREQFVPPVGCG